MRLGAKVVGELILALNFLPNHQSMKCLSVDCSLNQKLPNLIMEDILTILYKKRDEATNQSQSGTSSSPFLVPQEDVHKLISSVEFFRTFVSDRSVLSNLLYEQSQNASKLRSAVYSGEHPRPISRSSHSLDDLDERARRSSSDLGSRSGSANSRLDEQASVPLYKAANITKAFLTSVVMGLPQVKADFHHESSVF